jgi:hypothetical protein
MALARLGDMWPRDLARPDTPRERRDLRRDFAIAAPEPPAWYLAERLEADQHTRPAKPPRLLDLEREVASARQADANEAMRRATSQEVSPGVVRFGLVMPEESVLGLLYTEEMRREHQQLHDAHELADCLWRRDSVKRAQAAWPWYYADLVLATEHPHGG